VSAPNRFISGTIPVTRTILARPPCFGTHWLQSRKRTWNWISQKIWKRRRLSCRQV